MALATDYDGTIAHDGTVADETVEALERLKASGRRLILVTGRELPDLERVCPCIDVFDRIVAENGALLYTPSSKTARPLGPPPPPAFVERLRACNISPLSVGAVIVATWEPNETAVLEAIRDLGLDLQIIFNKGAVMVLPSGINKASGLHAALDDLGLSFHNVVAVGDAENDLAFMRPCGCAVAVANALPALKEAADLVTYAVRGQGVEELIGILVEDEKSLLERAIERHSIRVGKDQAGSPVYVRPGAGNILIAGMSGGGKSTLSTGLLERMAEHAMQFCILDPEGDYAEFEHAVVFGDAKSGPRVEPILEALRKPGTNVAVNMLGIDVADRPALFARLYPALLAERAATGRPHWILVDEAHHMAPKQREAGETNITPGEPPTVFITVHPEALADNVVKHLGAALCIGAQSADVIAAVAAGIGISGPAVPERAPERGEILFWECRSEVPPRIVTFEPPKQAQKRHTRKYAEGALGEDKSFYFKGPTGALNLRAQNLMIFLQLAEGVDEETFMHHLRAGDYSQWFRMAIKDEALAAEASEVELQPGVTPTEARARLRQAVETRYTAPAEGAA